MRTSDVTYEADGRTMIGRLAVPDGEGRRPGVLVAHEGNGLDEFQKTRAERFAELGFVTFALDYYGGGAPLVERDEINARLTQLMEDPERTSAIGQAGLDVLLAEPTVDPARIAAVGYCFGGSMVMELARSGADLKAVVGFHPGLVTSRPEASVNITGRVLVCIGADDPIVPAEHRTAFEADMRAAGVDWRMHIYGRAKHSFTHPHAARAGSEALEYHQLTDERSWRAMLDLFDEVLS